MLDKWFAMQATAPERDGEVFGRVKSLLAHPDFRWDPSTPLPLVLFALGARRTRYLLPAFPMIALLAALVSAAQGKAVFVYPDGVDDGPGRRAGSCVARRRETTRSAPAVSRPATSPSTR